MALHEFKLLLEGLPPDELLDQLMDTAQPDILIHCEPIRRSTEVIFIREAPTMIDAIVAAVHEVEACGLVPCRISGGDSDLVTLGMIADRVGRTREAVRLWETGRTGPGGFPSPVDTDASTRYYRWSQVVPWLREQMGIPLEDPDPILSVANLALQLRALAPRVSRMDAVRELLAA